MKICKSSFRTDSGIDGGVYLFSVKEDNDVACLDGCLDDDHHIGLGEVETCLDNDIMVDEKSGDFWVRITASVRSKNIHIFRYHVN